MGDVDATIAAGRVPTGLSADYLKQMVLSRCASRLLIVKSFGFDDALALVGLTLLIAFVALSIVLINLGSGRHYDYIQYVLPAHTVRLTETLDFLAHIIYTTALVTCRFSGLLFYHRIVSQSRRFATMIKCAVAFLVLSYLPQLFLLILHCRPVTTLWPYAWEPEVNEYTCLVWGVVYVTNSGISLLCDILLFGIPLAIIRFMTLSRRRKVGLVLIFFPGLLVIGISIARLVIVIQGQWNADESWTYDPMLAIETSEIGGTLIALSVPGLKPLFDKLFLKRKSGTDGPATFQSGGHGNGTEGVYKANGSGNFGWVIQGGSDDAKVSEDNDDNESTDVILRGVQYMVENHDEDEVPLKEMSVSSTRIQ